MRFYFYIILFLSGTTLNGFYHEDEKNVSCLSEFLNPLQDAPFYFLKPVPATMKIPGKAESKFFQKPVNSLSIQIQA